MFSRIALRRDGDGNRLELQTMRLWRSPKSLSLAVHAHFRRPHPESGQTVVQHGDARQSRKASRSSPSGSRSSADTTALQPFGPIRDEAACSRKELEQRSVDSELSMRSCNWSVSHP